MSLEAKDYNLPDFEIFNSRHAFDCSVWQPDKSYIVIGRANTVEHSVFVKAAEKDKIQILKRPSGGESVLLSPQTLVISVKLNIEDTLNSHQYFKIINEHIIYVLKNHGVQRLNRKGISDISIGHKKILGSSIYRKSDTIFYHAVLNVSESTEKMEKYLKYPKREPDYRKGRSHHEFVTSLKNESYSININSLLYTIKSRLEKIPTLSKQTASPAFNS